ncbi:MAG: hypothetical protein GY765_31855, partial [bacterium]|nr:hypothetical protein [bacterium]
MSKTIFQDMIPERAPRKMWGFFVFSFFSHCTIIALLIVMPISRVSDTPIRVKKDVKKRHTPRDLREEGKVSDTPVARKEFKKDGLNHINLQSW